MKLDRWTAHTHTYKHDYKGKPRTYMVCMYTIVCIYIYMHVPKHLSSESRTACCNNWEELDQEHSIYDKFMMDRQASRQAAQHTWIYTLYTHTKLHLVGLARNVLWWACANVCKCAMTPTHHAKVTRQTASQKRNVSSSPCSHHYSAPP